MLFIMCKYKLILFYVISKAAIISCLLANLWISLVPKRSPSLPVSVSLRFIQ